MFIYLCTSTKSNDVSLFVIELHSVPLPIECIELKGMWYDSYSHVMKELWQTSRPYLNVITETNHITHRVPTYLKNKTRLHNSNEILPRCYHMHAGIVPSTFYHRNCQVRYKESHKLDGRSTIIASDSHFWQKVINLSTALNAFSNCRELFGTCVEHSVSYKRY